MSVAQYIHGITIKKDNSTIIVVNEHDENHNSKLKYYINPTRRVWVTKSEFRNHNMLKESEQIPKLDEIITTDRDMPITLEYALAPHGRKPYRIRSMFELNRSPYTYGTDISTQTLIKRAYNKKCGNIPMQLKFGTLDIETDMLGKGDIINIGYIDNATKTIYMTYKASKFQEPDQRDKDVTLDDIVSNTKSILGNELQKLRKDVYDKVKTEYTQVLYAAKSEEDLIRWSFDKIHMCKPDMCGIWNIGFDIPYILERLVLLGIPATEIFCHPDVKEQYKHVYYKEDKSKQEHKVDRWHQMYASGYTRFVDFMQLYGRLRKVYGREISYALDYISEKILGVKKYEIIPGATHNKLQRERYKDYCTYNIIDTILLDLMEELNDDIGSMLGLIANSPLDSFSKQTVMLKDSFFDYCVDNGLVSGSTSGKNLFPYHSEFGELAGGGVLSPNLALDVGTFALKHNPTLRTNLCRFVLDLDVVEHKLTT